MTIKDEQMNIYSLIRKSTVYVLTVALITSTFAIPFTPQTGAEPLSPPNMPGMPTPSNGSIDVSITIDLSWICDDPNGDPVTFDVYFGNVSPPPKIASNHTMTLYDLGTLNLSTTYYWQIIAWDNHSEYTVGPLWWFTTITQLNNPPNKPHSENPSTGSTGIPLTQILSWTGGDPDVGDTVTYDVYFGTTSPPAKVVANQSAESYDPIITAYNTKYYWKIVAWDNSNATNVGDLWEFTTIGEGSFTVTITKPEPGVFYFNDVPKLNLPGNTTIVYGKITISANVTSSTTIVKVEFYADEKLIGEDTESPYSIVWQPLIQFSTALSLKRTIKVVAYDNEGNNASVNITVIKWRFHLLPWIIAGMAFASRLVLHTTVVGVFFNVRESRFSVSFYAIRAHYKTVGLVQLRKGVLNFKHCSGGAIIGPTTLTKIGLFHKFAIGSFTFIGGLNDQKMGLGGSLLSGFLQSRFSDRGGPFSGLRALR